MYGIEAWGGAKKSSIKKIQQIQDKMSKLMLGKRGKNLLSNQRQRLIRWLPINQEILSATHRMTYKLISTGIPEELASVMPINNKSLRIKGKKKLDTKPAWLSKSKVAKATFRGRVYVHL